MIGYSSESKAYRLFNPENNNIIISRDVVFLEQSKVSVSIDKDFYYPELLQSYDDVNSEESVNVELTPEVESTPEVEHASDDADSASGYTDASEYDDSVGWPSPENTPADNDDVWSPNSYEAKNLPVVEEARRSNRITSESQRSQNFCPMQFVADDPGSVKDALSSNNSSEWKIAMKEEIDSLDANKTWVLTELPPGEKAIKSKWVFKTKRDEHGNAVRWKARLVAKGFSQREGIDFTETFAPVVRYDSIRYLLALAVKHDMYIHQMDAVSAYLNGSLKEIVYMEQPEMFDDGSEKVCKLEKSIYGLKQSGRVWNETINNELIKMGLVRGEADQCIYHKVTDGQMLFVAIYVDDVLIFSNNLKSIKSIKKKLGSKFKMKYMGEASSVLGMKITRSQDEIKIDQSQYIGDVLVRFGMNDCNPTSTPIDYNQKLSTSMSPKDDEGKQQMSKIPYMQAIGCLSFAAQISRPDICYAVNLLSQFGTNPGKPHWEAVKRVMRYLKGTIDKGIVYKKQIYDEIKSYCDSDWAGNLDDRQSTTGHVFVYQSAAISWATKKQKTVALSSTEAEFMSLTAAIQESVWLRRLEAELDPTDKKSLRQQGRYTGGARQQLFTENETCGYKS